MKAAFQQASRHLVLVMPRSEAVPIFKQTENNSGGSMKKRRISVLFVLIITTGCIENNKSECNLLKTYYYGIDEFDKIKYLIQT